MVEKNENKKVIIDNKYELKYVLGKGATSKVCLALDLQENKNVALKIFDSSKNFTTIKEWLNKEVEIMKKIQNENLVRYLSSNIEGKSVCLGKKDNQVTYIALDLYENREMIDYLLFYYKPFNEPISLYYFKQIIKGISAMHEQGICHRDLKLENIFLDEKFNLKIGDFGFSKYIDQNENNGKFKMILGTHGSRAQSC